ncbi:hypothetical protein LZ30DRAFT_321503 [Colletotrichum cereale]|nr:hypothetical protein LZ30DRAFT_321503 [Colletotrichum cereale]
MHRLQTNTPQPRSALSFSWSSSCRPWLPNGLIPIDCGNGLKGRVTRPCRQPVRWCIPPGSLLSTSQSSIAGHGRTRKSIALHCTQIWGKYRMEARIVRASFETRSLGTEASGLLARRRLFASFPSVPVLTLTGRPSCCSRVRPVLRAAGKSDTRSNVDLAMSTSSLSVYAAPYGDP